LALEKISCVMQKVYILDLLIYNS